MESKLRNRSPFARRLAAALAVGTAGSVMALALAAPAHAQESNASLRGSVAGATQITAIEVDTGIRRTVAVGSDGSYNFASLRPGTYRLEITTPQGVRQTDEFTLNVAQDAVLDFDDLATAPTTTPDQADAGDTGIIVTGTRIRTLEGGEVGTTITQRQIEQLPQNNRNFLAFADLAPGVQFVTNGSDQSRLQGGAQDSRTVNVFIDGVGQKDYVLKNGITGQDSTQGNPFPQLAVGEYRVISSNYKAEFDQVSSVAITAITKSGTNELHGEAFIDFTNQDFRDRTPSEIRLGRKIVTEDIQFGGALSGPIIQDTLFFFGTYEGKRRKTPREINPGLDLPVSFFPTEYQDVFGTVNETFVENLYFGKLSFAPTSRDLFEATVKYRDESGEQFNGGITAYETRGLARVEEWRGLARWEHTADSFINDLKVTYENAAWNPRPFLFAPRYVFNATVPNPPPATTSRRGNILEVGGGTNFQDKGQEGWGIQNDFTWTALEGHTIKAGVKAKWVTLNTFQQNFFNPRYEFNVTRTPGEFNDTVPYQVQFNAPALAENATLTSDNFQFGIYIQDDWEVTDRLTLNIGLRWDYEETPAFLNYIHPADRVAAVSPANYPNLNNANYDINDYISTGTEREAFMGAFQPRIGFTYEFDEQGRFAVFGGYGRAYDRNQFDFIQQELAQGPNATRTFQFQNTGNPNGNCTPSPTCVPFDPIYLTPAGLTQLFNNSPPGAGGELRFINNDLKVPYSDQFSLGLRGRFGLLNAEVGYSHIESKDGFVYLLGNRRPDGSFFPPTGNPGAPFGFPPAPFGSIIIGDNGIETTTDSAYFKLDKVYTQASPWSFAATYTYTDAEENRQFGETFSLDYPSIEDYPFTPSAGVRRHRLVMTGTADIPPLGITLSGKFQIASPRFLNTFIFTPGDPLSRDIATVETEGNGDRWGFRQMDFAATKYIPLSFINDEARIRLRVDVINLFNDRNYNSFNAVTGRPNRFTNPNADGIDGPPRTVKLSAGFSF
jgi:outer membrane receptor protein involved in Fe transport